MTRRAIITGLLLGVLGLMLFGISGAFGQDGGEGRYKTVEIDTTQYVWQLISNSGGRVICEVIVEHTGYPTQDEAITICGQEIFPPEITPTASRTQTVGTPQPTPTPFNINVFLQNASWKLVDTRRFVRTVQVPLPEMFVSISALEGPVQRPYVIITAYEPALEYEIAEIRGTVGNSEFVCKGSRCEVPLTQDAIVVFWAVSTLGDESGRVTADVRMVLREDGYHVTIMGLSPFTLFNDTCGEIWGTRPVPGPAWAAFPNTPDELHTNKTLYYLANMLIREGIVDAQDCPGGGYFSASSPNACGLERSRDAMVMWQNMFDPIIWTSGRELGIPPKLIKTLFEVESQFWPGNARYFIFEYGLAQMNQLGADVALRWDNDLFTRVCTGLFFDCSVPYASLPTWMQATLRGGLMRVINAECPTCTNGIDLFNAQQSVPIITQTLRSNCQQVKYITDQQKVTATYEDYWRFTMVSYHGGYMCLTNAIVETKKFNEPIDWEHVSKRLDCLWAQDYVNNFWDSLTSFDAYVIPPADSQQPPAVPTFVPTSTPIPAPTPVLANSTLRVVVYVDRDGDQTPDADEMVDGVTVVVEFEDGISQVKTVSQGEAVFSMVGKPINSSVTVRLPALYRTYRTSVTAEGEVVVIFRLLQPVIPPVLP